MEPLLKNHEAAELLGVSWRTTELWRYQRKGPAWVRTGPGTRGTVRYRRQDILDFQRAKQEASITH